jgi:nucleoside-diphosphate-sugar epimerase
MRIAVMGSGGIGGYLGARLAQAGEDVIFIARGSHLEAMQQKGLRVESPLGEILLRALSHKLDSGGAMFGRPAAPQAAVAARHVRKASSRKTRNVRRDVRWRWALKVFWTAA